MGYELYITRKKDYFDEEGKDISMDEWHEYVESDPELAIDLDVGDHFARWSGDNRHGPGEAWFDWFEGYIKTKAPDEKILAKMLNIARAFGAKVQGDDGEVYVRPDLVNGFIFEDADE